MKHPYLIFTLLALIYIVTMRLIEKYIFQKDFDILSIAILLISGIVYAFFMYKFMNKRISNNQ